MTAPSQDAARNALMLTELRLPNRRRSQTPLNGETHASR